MTFLGLLRIALKAFARNRLRALLTALGIIIGVGAFVTMVAIGRGSRSISERSLRPVPVPAPPAAG